jgi:hypothetical protein
MAAVKKDLNQRRVCNEAWNKLRTHRLNVNNVENVVAPADLEVAKDDGRDCEAQYLRQYPGSSTSKWRTRTLDSAIVRWQRRSLDLSDAQCFDGVDVSVQSTFPLISLISSFWMDHETHVKSLCLVVHSTFDFSSFASFRSWLISLTR